MEVLNYTQKKEDTTTLSLMHLSQLLGYFIGFGSLIAPLVIWLSSRDRIEGMDEHGKQAVNFQISLLIYIFVSIPLIFALGLGLLTLFFAIAIGFIMPIVNALRASRGEAPSYFMTIRFL
ncbi:MAG: tRNA modification GTPase [Flavobacteriaceae bacterium]|nr:tRNA modification GTPase [Flavobacteriaceae bacterium]|tara:strand:- start:13050 stop:13409 length:360 start_codon:yes stop_codon:yes gene_type:complete